MIQQTKIKAFALLTGIILFKLSLIAQLHWSIPAEKVFNISPLEQPYDFLEFRSDVFLPIRGECDYEWVSLDIKCDEPAYDGLGNVRYKGKFTVRNNSPHILRLASHPNALPVSTAFFGTDNPSASLSLFSGPILSSCPPMPFITLTSPTGAGIAGSGGVFTSCFTLTVPIGTTSINFLSNGFTQFGTLDQAECRLAKLVTLPNCACNLCDSWEYVDTTVLMTPNLNPGSANNYLITQTFQINGAAPIMKMKAEIVYVRHETSDKPCYTCTKEENRMGLIPLSLGHPKDISATNLDWRNNNKGMPVNDDNGDDFSNSILWEVMDPATGIDFSSSPRIFEIPISLPRAHTLQCCDHEYEVCIRYTFTDINCKTCEFLSCQRFGDV